MNRLIRMRKYNPKNLSGKFDVLFPQTVSSNIIRSENGGVLESDLLQYDRHLGDNNEHLNRALSEGTARALSVRIPGTVLVDGFPLLLTLHVGLECEPTLSFNGGEPMPIISASGDRIPGGQMEGTTIFLVWNKGLQKWILMSSDNFVDVTKVVLPVVSEYAYAAQSDGEEIVVIPGFNKKSDKLEVNYGQTILRKDIDYEYVKSAIDAIHLIDMTLDKGDVLYFQITKFIVTARRGHYRYELKATDFPVAATEDAQSVFSIPAEADGCHSMVVNYSQTILRNNLDYTIDPVEHTITLNDFVLPKDDVLVFTITRFQEAPGELVPNNWGATGNYRYSLNVIHGSYVATEDHIAVFPVPEFNFKKDDISLIKDNKLYIYDVDYTIDEIGNIVLLKTELNTDDEIFFTILQGAMMDVPDFNVIEANGYDGQHILLNMNYSVLCNFYVLLIRLKHDLLDAPTIKCIDGPAEMICDCFHEPIRKGYKKGSYLWVVYSESEHLWYSLSHSQVDISTLVPQHIHATGESTFLGQADDPGPGEFMEQKIRHGMVDKEGRGVTPDRVDIMPSEPGYDADGVLTPIGDIWTHADDTFLYVGNTGKAVSHFRWSATTEDATNDLRSYIDQQIVEMKQRPGNIEIKLSTFTAVDDGTMEIPTIADFNGNVDKLIVNFNQTVLRPEYDYIINPDRNGIILKGNMSLDRGDILQFIVLKQSF